MALPADVFSQANSAEDHCDQGSVEHVERDHALENPSEADFIRIIEVTQAAAPSSLWLAEVFPDANDRCESSPGCR